MSTETAMPRIPDRVIAQVERAADAMLSDSMTTTSSTRATNTAKLAAHGYDAVATHRKRAATREQR